MDVKPVLQRILSEIDVSSNEGVYGHIGFSSLADPAVPVTPQNLENGANIDRPRNAAEKWRHLNSTYLINNS